MRNLPIYDLSQYPRKAEGTYYCYIVPGENQQAQLNQLIDLPKRVAKVSKQLSREARRRKKTEIVQRVTPIGQTPLMEVIYLFVMAQVSPTQISARAGLVIMNDPRGQDELIADLQAKMLEFDSSLKSEIEYNL